MSERGWVKLNETSLHNCVLFSGMWLEYSAPSLKSMSSSCNGIRLAVNVLGAMLVNECIGNFPYKCSRLKTNFSTSSSLDFLAEERIQ